jgi:hypothetical protein
VFQRGEGAAVHGDPLFRGVVADTILKLNFVHHVENILVLSFYFDADSLALFTKFLLKVNEPNFTFACFGEQNHIKKSVQDVLINAQDVDVVVG